MTFKRKLIKTHKSRLKKKSYIFLKYSIQQKWEFKKSSKLSAAINNSSQRNNLKKQFDYIVIIERRTPFSQKEFQRKLKTSNPLTEEFVNYSIFYDLKTYFTKREIKLEELRKILERRHKQSSEGFHEVVSWAERGQRGAAHALPPSPKPTGLIAKNKKA